NFQERNKHLKSEQIVLTRREKEVLNETLKGKKIKEIADALFISVKTVENHRSNLFVKFEVSNVSGLIKKALLLSYLPDTD
ncbi:MAG TPA: LuxR C-terminal-related transcriptional regulator, partial [Brumimicrobium sp.]|nr:LuxR C-terminal-related transcriptional regulator [Brumimicrobium sp.]